MELKLLPKLDVEAKVAHISQKFENRRRSSDTRFQLRERKLELGNVSNVYPGADGKVRRVDVQYKNLTASEPMKQYQGKGYVTVQRPVQRLGLLIPIDEN